LFWPQCCRLPRVVRTLATAQRVATPENLQPAPLYVLASNWKLKLIAIDKEPQDDILHLDRCGEAERLANQTLV
jgi:hypothetical protein